MKFKIIVGFRRDQEYSLDIEEAHKAYYLFLHPEARTVFSDGTALIGEDIKSIVPDYHGSMGWNPSHIIDSDDWNDIRSRGVESKIQNMLAAAKELAPKLLPEEINAPLSLLIEKKQLHLQARNNTTKSIGDILGDASVSETMR